MRMRRARAAGTSGALVAGVCSILPLAVALFLAAPLRAEAQTKLFDLDLDDRTDPVRPGENVVYEVNTENGRSFDAPDVVITDFLPPGTTYVSAHRAPDYAEIPAQVFSDRVEWHIGALEPCGRVGFPPCRDIWATFHVGGGVAPGTVLTNHVEMTSSDPANFPLHQDTTYTSVGTAAIRRAKVTFPVLAGRDRVTVEADLARDGRSTPFDPAPPTIDPTQGIRVVLSEPGGATALDVTVPGSAIKCIGSASTRCRLDDPRVWRPLGLARLTVFLPLPFLQRRNAQVIVRTSQISLPDDFGPVVQLRIESGSDVYTDVAELTPGPNRLVYSHKQNVP